MHSAQNKPRLLVFAMNSVTVALIGIEILRHNGAMSKGISDWFKSFCEDRERIPDVMLVTHIYLLMGCALPVTITYILLSGSVFPSEWVLYSLAGVVFLGIGDSCAAIFGRKFGKTKWRELSNKTQEGSTYCVIGILIAYFGLCKLVDDHHMYYVSIYQRHLDLSNLIFLS